MEEGLSRKQKSSILMIVDSLFILLSAFLAHYIVQLYVRPDTKFYYVMIGVCIGLYLILGFRHHLFTRIVRYTSVYEIMKATKLMTFSFAVSAFLTIIFIKSVSFRYIFLMYMFCLVFIPGSRVIWRFYHENFSNRTKQSVTYDHIIRTLVVGAGDGGNLFLSNILKDPGEIAIVGLVDGDSNKKHS